MKTILRWIAVLPAAILSFYVAFTVFVLLERFFVGYYIGSTGDSWISLYVIPLIASYISSALFIVVGVYVAPSYKKITGLILLVLFCMFDGMCLLRLFEEFKIQLLLQIVGQSAGVVMGFIALKDTFQLEGVSNDF